MLMCEWGGHTPDASAIIGNNIISLCQKNFFFQHLKGDYESDFEEKKATGTSKRFNGIITLKVFFDDFVYVHIPFEDDCYIMTEKGIWWLEWWQRERSPYPVSEKDFLKYAEKKDHRKDYIYAVLSEMENIKQKVSFLADFEVIYEDVYFIDKDGDEIRISFTYGDIFSVGKRIIGTVYVNGKYTQEHNGNSIQQVIDDVGEVYYIEYGDLVRGGVAICPGN